FADMSPWFKRPVGCVLVGALFWLSPGAGFHEALASGFLRKEAVSSPRGRVEQAGPPEPSLEPILVPAFELPAPETEASLSPAGLSKEWSGIRSSVDDSARPDAGGAGPAYGAGRAIETFLTRARGA